MLFGPCWTFPVGIFPLQYGNWQLHSFIDWSLFSRVFDVQAQNPGLSNFPSTKRNSIIALQTAISQASVCQLSWGLSSVRISWRYFRGHSLAGFQVPRTFKWGEETNFIFLLKNQSSYMFIINIRQALTLHPCTSVGFTYISSLSGVVFIPLYMVVPGCLASS